METNQLPVEAASMRVVKTNNPAATLKEHKQLRQSPPPKPTKKRFISKQSMAFMHC
ncbi:hypothetical protein PC129_g5881 [Phytophthora cactorum]|uniref:Uncharacterized protein n=1 Tax=Phytophthora cactorum TaxID=29920 RepID=A0A8T1DZS2_9STRA|nr:hypothetical protein PC113_g2783 [Phytophthora cactorum]KAG2900315.1 hypothetical protein PC115_g16242 [Phytophthora cactorum]KAG2946726.1 hypothetical protein PC117_g7402 [Phytophthora cactorum]KAG2988184.1 hypothetical protein PC118_g6878 [Phytophthora cactorum]KAG3025508.1 hypothetical protein PC120_g6435 [Phytophthora cactorum]